MISSLLKGSLSVALNEMSRIIHSRYAREPLIILLAYIPYFLARGHAVSNAETAFKNAHELIRVESSIGIFKELSVQSAALSYQVLVHIANIVYFYGHWPVIICAGLYLFFAKPRVYTVTRNAFLISGFIALLLYAFFPVAPPRLSADGMVDTLAMTVPVSLDKSRLVNPYAALPSLHVGWDLLIALGLFLGFNNRIARAAALLLPLAMLIATVATGNHFFIDGIAGATLALAAFGLARWLYPRWPLIQARLLALVWPRKRLTAPE
jgi:membrane-associated phospholipid phosphatase